MLIQPFSRCSLGDIRWREETLAPAGVLIGRVYPNMVNQLNHPPMREGGQGTGGVGREWRITRTKHCV